MLKLQRTFIFHSGFICGHSFTMEIGSAASCKLKIPSDMNGKSPVFIVNFPNGSVNLQRSNQLNFKCYKQTVDSDTNFQSKRILCATNGRLNFQSAITDKSNCCENRYSYFVGVRNKETGKMKVYNSSSFVLKPIIKTRIVRPSTPAEKSYRERLNDLTTSFGSKGKKRSMVARKRYATDTNLLDGALEDMTLKDSPVVAKTSVRSKPISSTDIEYVPLKNPDAKSVEEVYNINDIVPVELHEFLTQQADELLRDLPNNLTMWTSDRLYCDYVLKHLESGVDISRVKFLVYFDSLFKFSSLRSTDIRKKDPVPEISEPIKSNLLDVFTVSAVSEFGRVSRTFPLKMKDKLLAYMIVLALFIDDYSVNLCLVQSGTKYGLPKVINVAQAVGCHVTRQKVGVSFVQFAQLKLPLFVLRRYSKKF